MTGTALAHWRSGLVQGEEILLFCKTDLPLAYAREEGAHRLHTRQKSSKALEERVLPSKVLMAKIERKAAIAARLGLALAASQ